MHPHDIHQSFLSEINPSLADQIFTENDIHQSFLSEINPSLADQIFTEKERLDTTDRFLWHGGIQKCDIIAKVTKNYVLF